MTSVTTATADSVILLKSMNALRIAEAIGKVFSRTSTIFIRASVLHAPLVDGALLDGAEDEVLHQEADQDDREEPGEDVGDLQQVLVLEDEPAQSARALADAEHELGGVHRGPGERPADLEAGQDARERRGNQDLQHVPRPGEAVVAADHPQRLG